MERLFNCEILDKKAVYEKFDLFSGQNSNGKMIKRTRNRDVHNEFDSNEEDEEEHKGISYTELYQKYKEKYNCLQTHNKRPVHAYMYPKNVQVQKFDELKNELLNKKMEERQEKIRRKIKGEEEIAREKEKLENESKIYHEADLKIYAPKEFFLKKKKKTLREKIYDGEVMFYEDYIEQVAAADYERFFKKPYKVKRQDEGGNYFFFGKKLEMTQEEDIYRKYYNLDDEYFIKNLKKKDDETKKEKTEELVEIKEDVREFDEDYENLSYRDKSYILKLNKESKKNNLNAYGFYKKNKNIIFNKHLPEIKKKELINGNIPDIILPINTRKKKHPQQCTVPFSRLHNYAISLENLKICSYIHGAIDEELSKNWKSKKNNDIEKLRPERPRKGYKKDIYIVTKENLEKSKEKLKTLIQKDEEAQAGNETQSFKNIAPITFQKKERETIKISGGRYVI